ncbi:hypothetical protein D6777_04040, partial [Candidatus Woesearchaeota archaeon]
VRHVAVIIVFFLILILAANYVNLNKVFDKDNIISKTGAVVVDTVKDNVDFNTEEVKKVIEKNLKNLDKEVSLP